MRQIFYILIYFFCISLYSDDSIIRNVRYLIQNPDVYSFSKESVLRIRNGILLPPEKSADKSGKTVYAVPAFCDAGVTLTSDSLGGAADGAGIRTSFRSFLYHGFTHVMSIADTPSLKNIYKDVLTGKIPGPEILFSGKIILPFTSEYESYPEEVYAAASGPEEILAEAERQTEVPFLRIFHRYFESENYSLTPLVLHKFSAGKRKYCVTAFADRISVLDAVRTRTKCIEHPIPDSVLNEFDREYEKELIWIPYFNLYRNLWIETDEEERLSHLDLLKQKSRFFEENYFSAAKEFRPAEMPENANAASEYRSYLNFLRNRKILLKKMALGSGSGHRFSFPGISGLDELSIIISVSGGSADILRIPTENTCSLIGGKYRGRLEFGSPADLLIFSENPAEKPENIFSLEKVFYRGREQRSSVRKK